MNWLRKPVFRKKKLINFINQKKNRKIWKLNLNITKKKKKEKKRKEKKKKKKKKKKKNKSVLDFSRFLSGMILRKSSL